MGGLFFFILVMFFFGAFLRDEAVFTVLYIFVGLYLAGRWWGGRALNSLVIERTFTRRAFLGDDVQVRLELKNKGILPLVWLRVPDALPAALAVTGSFKRVLTMGPFSTSFFEYTILTRKRGFYTVGPFRAWSGDLFGLASEQSADGQPESLVVYPRIYNLPNFSLPSRSPSGTLRTLHPIFEDPSRIRSKRPYQSGDSLRRIDWKATAITGSLQVKQFEPSIALETMIFLNLDPEDYDMHTYYDSFELGIIMAASAANWVAAHKQAVGLATNGADPFEIEEAPEPANLPVSGKGRVVQPARQARQHFLPLPARKGRPHLMRLLDILARVVAPPRKSLPFLDLLRAEHVNLPWGTTLIVITPRIDEAVFDYLFQARRAGFNATLILVGKSGVSQQVRHQASIFHIPFLHISSEAELTSMPLQGRA